MRVLAAAAAMALVCSASVANAAGGALELTAANFDESLTGKSTLVMFKAPWCGHCKSMTPAFDEVADEFNSNGSGAQLAFVDCTVQEDLCQKHGVSGYPTLKVFSSEAPEGKDYQGGRDASALRKYAEDNLVGVQCTSKDQGAGCSEKEKAFLDKFTAAGKDAAAKELARLNGLKSGSMAPELKKWLFKRIAILKELDQ